MLRHRLLIVNSVVLLAVCAFSVGAHDSQAPAAVAITGQHRLVLADDGRIFTYPTEGFAWRQVSQCPPGIPVSLAQESSGAATYWLLMRSGEVYVNQSIMSPESPWVYQGNAIGGTVGTESGTWSTLKRRFRETHQ